MGEENGREPRTLKLPISAAATVLSFMDSPEHPSATPPLASVPFKWEEQPGKPRPCSYILARPEPKSLELPPMMMSRTPSPTSVLDGGGPHRPKCSSFRFFMDGHDSFLLHSATSTPGDGDDDASLEYGLVFGTGSSMKKKKKSSSRRYGFFGNKDKGGKKEFNGGISGFSPFSTTTSSCESDESFNIMRRNNSSFSSVPLPKSSSPITWATICSGLKQAIQWKSSRKSNKQGQH